ncbi:CAP domain-containing protein [Rhodobacter sp. Har01]|uniref:CAP domain-containing protein n=1 Tax=Rhodobacter sp. Har01 TaxID=2883999 RepID=UPI001D06BFD3|nr:CAP domain-containing protein [Rhodobacter sp. Har01]MCB6177515.1 CAP domain-containing protein [Rhodobacter sp. Har01]
MSKSLLAAAALSVAAMAALPAAACIIPANSGALQAELIAGVNAERARKGLAPLKLNAALDKAAQSLACDNAARLSISHVSTDGSHLQHRLRQVGYRFKTATENTGRGFATAARAVDWWMHSPKHKQNILMSATREIGVGIAMSPAPDSKLHWIIDMGRSK